MYFVNTATNTIASSSCVSPIGPHTTDIHPHRFPELIVLGIERMIEEMREIHQIRPVSISMSERHKMF